MEACLAWKPQEVCLAFSKEQQEQVGRGIGLYCTVQYSTVQYSKEQQEQVGRGIEILTLGQIQGQDSIVEIV